MGAHPEGCASFFMHILTSLPGEGAVKDALIREIKTGFELIKANENILEQIARNASAMDPKELERGLAIQKDTDALKVRRDALLRQTTGTPAATTTGAAGTSSPLTFIQHDLNEGLIPSVAHNGIVNVVARNVFYDVDHAVLIKDGKKLLEGGTISLQAESHPIEFRKVELPNLVG